ncbi:MAG: tRNA preQ1(34) S-adenosylmethionine ribosyltransferase-isomerase QueA [Anaerolineae bacterium]|nr:tRNA preQ1(34) S-adenosylmethionine ribosyltransferase-isomerase QueA [Anaerolineae bacterium]
MNTADYEYDLPPELIAQTPVEPRDASRLMVLDRAGGTLSHHHFRDLPGFLRPGDLLVHNDSRVIPARLFARKPTGGHVELLLLRPRSERVWETLARGRAVRVGASLALLDGPEGDPVGATAQVLEEGERGLRVLQFDGPVLPLAEAVGQTPLPPYIHAPLHDPERYQTVYARDPGSAASPTAGLHFTPDLLFQLREMGVRSTFVTLHVGLGTFRPVSEARIEAHHIHAEFCSLRPDVAAQINQAKLEGRRTIAVGTTAVRVLETAGRRAAGGCDDAASACAWQTVAAFEGDTDLFLYPGVPFRVVDAMITNFHLPRSTLLMLVAAFAGKDLLDRAYREAIRERYRFYSFGDAMFIA